MEIEDTWVKSLNLAVLLRPLLPRSLLSKFISLIFLIKLLWTAIPFTSTESSVFSIAAGCFHFAIIFFKPDITTYSLHKTQLSATESFCPVRSWLNYCNRYAYELKSMSRSLTELLKPEYLRHLSSNIIEYRWQESRISYLIRNGMAWVYNWKQIFLLSRC
jgi:hypothetical protein